MEVQNRIACLLEELNVSAYRMAKDTGINVNTIYALSSCPDRWPMGSVVRKIIEVYDVEINDILVCIKNPKKQ